MQQLESEKSDSRLVVEEVERSSELASVGGNSNYDSLLLQSPPNDNSLPVSQDNDFSSLLEDDPGDSQPATEMKAREGGIRKREKKEARLSKKAAKNNRVRFKYEIKLAKMEAQGTGIGGWISSFFAKAENPVKALAQVEHVPEQKDNPRNEYHTTVQAG